MPRTRPLAIATTDPNTRRDEFAARHDLRRMDFTGRSLARLVRSAGGRVGLEAMRSAHHSYGRRLSDGELAGQLMLGCLDHQEMYGRGGRPLVLVGHPYQLDARSQAQLQTLSSIGLEVMVGRQPAVGWHGFAKVHVRCWVPGALPEPTPGERFATLMEIF